MCGKSNIIDKLREKLAIAAQQGERVRIIRVRARLLLGEAKRRLQLARQQQ